MFDFLALAAIIDGSVLCVHGGLSPEIRTLDQIRVVARAQEIPHEGAFCDLVWSDPEGEFSSSRKLGRRVLGTGDGMLIGVEGVDVETWAVSPRGAGWLFGDKVATEVKFTKFTYTYLVSINMCPTVQPCKRSVTNSTSPSARE